MNWSNQKNIEFDMPLSGILGSALLFFCQDFICLDPDILLNLAIVDMFIIGRAPGMEFLGKRAPGMEFVGKRWER